jgi:D-alanine-D-alanine ligase
MANVPFVGCGLFSSAVAMDKVLTKQVIAAENIPVVPYVWFTKDEWKRDKSVLQDKIEKLSWPLFVKPVHLGSSIAIAKVKDKTALEQAIEVALHYDDKVLVEESVENLIEVTLPIMGSGELRLATIERPLNRTEFFDFNDKYLTEGKTGSGTNNAYSEIPANISTELASKVENLGRQVYRVLGCSGTARIDFLIDSKNEKVFVNEVNTLPGSLYHHNWKKSGVSNVELVSTLITLAEQRFEEEKGLTRVFKSEILNKAGGGKL